MTIAPDSISNPTLAVIRAHGIEDPALVRLMWKLADRMASFAWHREPVPMAWEEYRSLHKAFGVERWSEIELHLSRNIWRAVDWCKEQAKGVS